jgi:heptosyltransferase-2
VTEPKRILVFQTAFLGDVILTLPMVQLLHERYPQAVIDMVTTPAGAQFLANHPAVHEIIKYDKRKTQKGLRGLLAMAIFLNGRNYDLAVVPHRSFRTTMIMALSRIPYRIGFSNAAGTMFYHATGTYDKTKHEVERNLALLAPLGITTETKVLPTLYPSAQDVQYINKFLFEREILEQNRMIAVAPGSVWNTKRWLPERFAETAMMLAKEGFEVVIIGGSEDSALAAQIIGLAKNKKVHDCTGKLSLLQSAELIRRSRVLVTNDSAPLHMAVAMRTPVVAVFGATVPEFGFAPYGAHDVVIQINGLPCRPCAIHGGNICPIGTFVCMKNIDTVTVVEQTLRTASQSTQ